MYELDHRIINRPIPVRWGGWETDTYRLMEDGWVLSAYQDVHYNKMQLAMKHPKLNVQGISMLADFDYEALLNGHTFTVPFFLKFKSFAEQVHVHTAGNISVNEFRPIDARPTYEAKHSISRLEDLANFPEIVPEVPENAIHLKEANMAQILEMALQRQEPEQERIREELLQQRDLQKMRQGQLHTELRLVA